jgi:hypothetical protein
VNTKQTTQVKEKSTVLVWLGTPQQKRCAQTLWTNSFYADGVSLWVGVPLSTVNAIGRKRRHKKS